MGNDPRSSQWDRKLQDATPYNLKPLEREALSGVQSIVFNRITRISTAEKRGTVETKSYWEWNVKIVLTNLQKLTRILQHQTHTYWHFKMVGKDPTVPVPKSSNLLTNKLYDEGNVDVNTQRWSFTEPNEVIPQGFYHVPTLQQATGLYAGRPTSLTRSQWTYRKSFPPY